MTFCNFKINKTTQNPSQKPKRLTNIVKKHTHTHTHTHTHEFIPNVLPHHNYALSHIVVQPLR